MTNVLQFPQKSYKNFWIRYDCFKKSRVKRYYFKALARFSVRTALKRLDASIKLSL